LESGIVFLSPSPHYFTVKSPGEFPDGKAGILSN